MAAAADRYDGHWRRFSDYCARRGAPSLPVSTTTVVRYVGSLWRRGKVIAVSLKPLLAALRKRHLAAGFPNPCDADSVREAQSGFRRSGLVIRPQPSRAAVPLPSTTAWSLALVATSSPCVLRHRLTAVVCAFWWMRRAKDLIQFTLEDVDLRPDGRTCFIVRYHKTAAVDGPISRELPRSDNPDADVPRQLLARLLADRRAADAGPGDRLFSDCHPKQASATLTAWLREGLARIGMSAPLGAR